MGKKKNLIFSKQNKNNKIKNYKNLVIIYDDNKNSFFLSFIQQMK
jgi:hypothetical protein